MFRVELRCSAVSALFEIIGGHYQYIEVREATGVGWSWMGWAPGEARNYHHLSLWALRSAVGFRHPLLPMFESA